jgi:hypothetical protein
VYQGVCRPLPGAGQPCLSPTFVSTTPTQCDPDPDLGLQCVGSGFNGTGTCLAPGQMGDACGGTGLAACGAGLACAAPSVSAIGACQPAPTTGQPCTTLGECLTPSVCNPATKMCDLPGTLHEGEPCAANTHCASLLCGPSSTDPSKLVCLRGQANVSCTGVNGGAGFVSPSGMGGIGGTTGSGRAGGPGGPPPIPVPTGGGGGGGAGSGFGGTSGTGTGTGTAGASGASGASGSAGAPGTADCSLDLGVSADTVATFEDGTVALQESEGRMGAFFTEGDGSPTCMQMPAASIPIPGGRCKSSRAILLSGGGCTQRGAVLGADFVVAAASAPVPYDLSQFSGVSFWARVDPGTVPLVRVSFPDLDTDSRGGCTPSGALQCDDDFGLGVMLLSDVWQRVDVPFALLQQRGDGVPVPTGFDPTHVFGIRFTAAPGPSSFNLWIDDVTLLR